MSGYHNHLTQLGVNLPDDCVIDRVFQSLPPSTTKKDTSVTFWAERIFLLSYLWHFYDDNCDKTRYHHRCGGILLLWQKIMTENGLFVLGGPDTHLHAILWAVHDEKIMVEARARKISGSSRLQWVFGGRALRLSLVPYTRVCEALGSNWTRARHRLTEPERLHYRLRVTEPERLLTVAAYWNRSIELVGAGWTGPHGGLDE